MLEIEKKAFDLLIDRADSSPYSQAFISWEDTRKWSHQLMDYLVRENVVEKYKDAETVECTGCENNCYEDVVTIETNNIMRAFVVCHDHEMQSSMGRIKVDINRLQQWKIIATKNKIEKLRRAYSEQVL